MVETFIKTSIMYLLVVFALRILGKRQLSDFEASELVVTIMISEIAATPVLDKRISIITCIVAIVLLLIFELIISFLAFKVPKARKILYGTPSVFFEKGKLRWDEMKRQRFSVTDIMEAIRNNGFSSLSEVDYVIMETNGNLSVLPKASSRAVSPEDLSLCPEETLISYVLIDDGKILYKNLDRIGKNKEWLINKLKEEKIKSEKGVFFFSSDKNGRCFMMKKED